MINSDKLKGLMREKRIVQADIARAIGKEPCTINQKINNKRAMTLEEAEIIAELLGINAADFGIYFFAHQVA